MQLKTTGLVFLSVALLSACTTAGKSVGAGAAIGAVGGASIGGIADPGQNGEYRTRNVVVGATLGTMIGALSGAVLHEKMAAAKKGAFEKGKASPTANPSGQPKLTEPKVEAHWMEGRAQGNRYIEGHWEYVILEPARWSGEERR